jgi:nucleoid-associated protein YgaU
MALCAGVAAVTVSIGAIGSVGAVRRRAAAIRIPLPARSLATLLMMASLVSIFARPRAATATIAPPIVRLTDESAADNGDATPSPSAGNVPAATSSYVGHRPSGDGVHVVEPGESLWRIAGHVLVERTGVEPSSAEIARFWPAIYEANRGTIGENPNLIFPGQRLVIPEG